MPYVQQHGKRDFFSNVAMVLPGSGHVGLDIESLSGSPEPCLNPFRAPRGSRWHDCRIIPGEVHPATIEESHEHRIVQI